MRTVDKTLRIIRELVFKSCTVKEISSKTEISSRTVYRYLKKMVEYGLVLKDYPTKGKYCWCTNKLDIKNVEVMKFMISHSKQLINSIHITWKPETLILEVLVEEMRNPKYNRYQNLMLDIEMPPGIYLLQHLRTGYPDILRKIELYEDSLKEEDDSKTAKILEEIDEWLQKVKFEVESGKPLLGVCDICRVFYKIQ